MGSEPVAGRVAASAVAVGRVASVFAVARDRVDPAYRLLVGRLPPVAARVVGYHRGWWAADGATPGSGGGGGKMLRPALVLLCAAAVGVAGRRSVDAAVCVEMIHDWSLLHDDVMDRDEMRRHQRSVWAQFGVAQAVLAGDVLLGLAFGQAARLPFPSALLIADTVEELCVGQWADLDLAGGSACSVDQALMMVGARTGSLLALSCSLGARAGGADLGRAALFAQFGRELGIAYQAADDLLGIWGDPAVTGKPAGADIAARKASLPPRTTDRLR